MGLKSDLVDVLEAMIDGRLDEIEPEWDERATVCVCWPPKAIRGRTKRARIMKDMDAAAELKDVMVFPSRDPFRQRPGGDAGGRVLGVTAIGDDVEQAIERAYEAVDRISWPGMFCRRDIGQKRSGRN